MKPRRTKKNCNRGTALEWSEGKLLLEEEVCYAIGGQDAPRVPQSTSYGYTYLSVLDSPERLQILATLTVVIKPLLPNFLGRDIVILNFAGRFRNFIADTMPW